MVRVIIKGGVWRNTEDEILKAAVMKYGKNQWSRIASLLHRKSAKQCKTRWHEWLDPGIKKTEWSRTEDEKLLHMAKLMPTQWRTIAPIVGRTATQCLERYEYLLDEAQKKAEQSGGQDDELAEARKLKPGEIDPTPETKPARPDPVDMDEDELEMLSEARARLANTQGKKAKRKAREKQLSEARRLASLQKRRELRAAGISSGFHKFRRNPTHIDYSAEIPFEKPVPPGFYDPSEDKYVKDTTFKKQTRAEIEGTRRDDIENDERRKDREKIKKRKNEDDPEAIFAKKTGKKRSKLILPKPQISDKEMEDIVKIGRATDAIRELADDNPSSTLLSNYEATSAIGYRSMRTPTVYSDVLQKEAENLLTLQNAQTPLKGGTNVPLHDLNLQSALPQDRTLATPNVMFTGINSTPRSTFDGTPSSAGGQTPSGTPFRDQLNINASSQLDDRMEVKRALSSLPEPKNDYQIYIPEDTADESQEEVTDWIEDASEVDLINEQELEKARALALLRESKVIQRGLPKPSKINEQYFKTGVGRSEYNKADDMIKIEMINILQHDVEGKGIDYIDQEDIKVAASFIEQEMKTEEMIELNSNLWAVIEQCSSELILSQNKFTRLGVLPKKDQIDALATKFNMYRDWMNIRAKKTAKLEKRLKVRLAGYQSIAQNLSKRLEEVRTEIEACARDKVTFELLAAHENRSIIKRFSKLMEEVELQESREKELQARYSDRLHEKYTLEQALVRDDATISAEPVQYVS